MLVGTPDCRCAQGDSPAKLGKANPFKWGAHHVLQSPVTTGSGTPIRALERVVSHRQFGALQASVCHLRVEIHSTSVFQRLAVVEERTCGGEKRILESYMTLNATL